LVGGPKTMAEKKKKRKEGEKRWGSRKGNIVTILGKRSREKKGGEKSDSSPIRNNRKPGAKAEEKRMAKDQG